MVALHKDAGHGMGGSLAICGSFIVMPAVCHCNNEVSTSVPWGDFWGNVSSGFVRDEQCVSPLHQLFLSTLTKQAGLAQSITHSCASGTH